jgi:gluconate kinase
LSSVTLYHASLQRVVKVALLEEAKAGKTQRVLLYSTDLKLSGRDIVRYDSARYQIEFLFRDAKQATGLTHCQARNAAALHFHWNASFCALNPAKWQEAQRAATTAFRCFRASNAAATSTCWRYFLIS